MCGGGGVSASGAAPLAVGSEREYVQSYIISAQAKIEGQRLIPYVPTATVLLSGRAVRNIFVVAGYVMSC